MYTTLYLKFCSLKYQKQIKGEQQSTNPLWEQLP